MLYCNVFIRYNNIYIIRSRLHSSWYVLIHIFYFTPTPHSRAHKCIIIFTRYTFSEHICMFHNAYTSSYSPTLTDNLGGTKNCYDVYTIRHTLHNMCTDCTDDESIILLLLLSVLPFASSNDAPIHHYIIIYNMCTYTYPLLYYIFTYTLRYL